MKKISINGYENDMYISTIDTISNYVILSILKTHGSEFDKAILVHQYVSNLITNAVAMDHVAQF